MPAPFLVLYLAAGVCLLLAAVPRLAPKGEVRWGWLAMLLWLAVAVLRAAGVS